MYTGSDLTVIIPAAGEGYRAKSYGPKCLLPLDGPITLLDIQVKIIRELWPKCDILVVVGFEKHKVYKELPERVRVVENNSYKENSVIKSIALGLRASICSKALILYGDTLINRLTLASLPTNKSSIIIDRQTNSNCLVGAVHLNGLVQNLCYGIDHKWCNILYLQGKELSLFKDIVFHHEERVSKLLGFEVINQIIDKGGNIHGIFPSGMLAIEINNIKDLKEAQQAAKYGSIDYT